MSWRSAEKAWFVFEIFYFHVFVLASEMHWASISYLMRDGITMAAGTGSY
jgi:hypothetical protein